MGGRGSSSGGGGGGSAKREDYGSPKIAVSTDNNILTVQYDLRYEGKNISTGEITWSSGSAKDNKIDVGLPLKKLTGTEKQVKWAEDIRSRVLGRDAADMISTLKGKTNTPERKEHFLKFIKDNGFKSTNDYVTQGIQKMEHGILEISSAAEMIDKYRFR